MLQADNQTLKVKVEGIVEPCELDVYLVWKERVVSGGSDVEKKLTEDGYMYVDLGGSGGTQIWRFADKGVQQQRVARGEMYRRELQKREPRCDLPVVYASAHHVYMDTTGRPHFAEAHLHAETNPRVCRNHPTS
jgi:hypothetical protein